MGAEESLIAIENNFAALKSTFSGASAPSDPVAGMMWLDTTNYILKIRNSGNTAWLAIWDMVNNCPVGGGTAYQDCGINSDGNGAEWFDGVRKILSAKGSMVYASAAHVLAALAIGSANQKLFVNAAGDGIEWATGMAVQTFTRACDGASATVNYTGAAFRPSLAIIITQISIPSYTDRYSIGIMNGTTNVCFYSYGNFVYSSTTVVNLDGVQSAAFSSWLSNGVALAWTKIGGWTSYTAKGVIVYFR